MPFPGAFSFATLTQTMQPHDEDTLTVRFTPSGLDEMCWHLVTWDNSVAFERPTVCAAG